MSNRMRHKGAAHRVSSVAPLNNAETAPTTKGTTEAERPTPNKISTDELPQAGSVSRKTKESVKSKPKCSGRRLVRRHSTNYTDSLLILVLRVHYRRQEKMHPRWVVRVPKRP